MRVMVTGASGFIGRHLCKLLAERGHEVHRLTRKPSATHPLLGETREHQCDLGDFRAVERAMGKARPEAVFHLAANPLIKEGDDPCSSSKDVLATHHLLAAAPSGARFVFASSAAVYGDCPKEMWESDLPRPTSAYGAGKLGCEALVGAYTRLGRVSGLSLRLVASAGAGSTHGLVHDVCRKLASPSPSLVLIGKAPGSRKHLMHVSDAARAFADLGLGTAHEGVLNVAGAQTADVLEIARACMDAMGKRKAIEWDESQVWAGDNRLVRVASFSARRLGWTPWYDDPVDAAHRATLDIMSRWRLN